MISVESLLYILSSDYMKLHNCEKVFNINKKLKNKNCSIIVSQKKVFCNSEFNESNKTCMKNIKDYKCSIVCFEVKK